MNGPTEREQRWAALLQRGAIGDALLHRCMEMADRESGVLRAEVDAQIAVADVWYAEYDQERTKRHAAEAEVDRLQRQARRRMQTLVVVFREVGRQERQLAAIEALCDSVERRYPDVIGPALSTLSLRAALAAGVVDNEGTPK